MLGTRYYFGAVITFCGRKFSTKNTSVQSQTRKKRKPSEAKKKQKPEWNDQHKSVISAIKDGKSVFITGSAGTGKTLLVKHIIGLLRKMYKPSEVFVTGFTGVAACALGGQTLHSFAGIVNPMADRMELCDQVMRNGFACRRWRRAKALVIDEISMVDGEFFEALEGIAREIRGVGSVWGGIQLVVSGDFFQLPPIRAKEDDSGGRVGKEFAFEAECWNSSFGLQVALERVYRQSDSRLVMLLQGIRRGECDKAGLELLRQCCSSDGTDSSVVELYPRNSDVVRVNAERLKGLRKETFAFRAVDSGKERWMRQLALGIAPDEVSLCEGARVMLTKNLDTKRKLVNGATGTVVGFRKAGEDAKEVSRDGLMPIVEFDFGRTMFIEPETWTNEEGNKVVAKRTQIPIILAWSISVHKCQGMTLDRLRTDLSKAFGFGMVYVALSRVRSLEGLYLSGLSPWKIKAHPKVVQFYKDIATDRGLNGGQGD